MTVTIESAGSHVFDLGHLRREGGERLVTLLLEKAGFDTDLTWRVQVQKKLLNNSETPPVRVVGAAKKWAVYLKIKPGDNNSCHFCSLLMPDGYQGPDVYETLKSLEQDLNRNWKHTAFERIPMSQPVAVEANGSSTYEAEIETVADIPRPAPVIPPPPAPAARVPERQPPKPPEVKPAPEPVVVPKYTTTKGWVGDPEKTRLLLKAIHEISSSGLIVSLEHFVQMLCTKLNWEGVNRYEVGGVFTSLVRKDLIMRLVRGSKPIGYELTEDGWNLVKDMMEAKPPVEVAAAPERPTVDRVQVIRSFGPFAMKFTLAQERLDQIAVREAELDSELEELRSERAEICEILEDRQVQELIERLYQAR